MGSELHLTALTADPARARAAFAAVFAEFERLEGSLSVWREGSDVDADEPGGGRRAGAGARRHARRAAGRRAGQRLDRRRLRHHLRRAGRGLEVRPRPGQPRAVVRRDRRASAARRPSRRGRRRGRRHRVDHAARRPRPSWRHRQGLRRGQGRGHPARGRASPTSWCRPAAISTWRGRPATTPWRLGIQDPRGPAGESFALVELSDATFSTSGDYERFFEQDGVRYHHLLDPSTGQPARGTRSVTIVTREATWADGLSTGVFILGPERGMALVERLPDVEAVIVTADNEVRVSSGLRGQRRHHGAAPRHRRPTPASDRPWPSAPDGRQRDHRRPCASCSRGCASAGTSPRRRRRARSRRSARTRSG